MSIGDVSGFDSDRDSKANRASSDKQEEQREAVREEAVREETVREETVREEMVREESVPEEGARASAEQPAESEKGRGLGWLNDLMKLDENPSSKEATRLDAPADARIDGEEDAGATLGAQATDEEVSFIAEAAAGEESAGGGASDEEDAVDREALLEEVLEDGVVRDLIQQGEVTAAQVRAAKRERTAGQQLWRAVAALEEARRASLFRAAARQAGVKEVERFSDSSIHAGLKAVPAVHIGALLETGFLPIGVEGNGDGPEHLVLATHDPTGPVAQEHAQMLDRPVTLRYAPEEKVQARIDALMNTDEVDTGHARGEASDVSREVLAALLGSDVQPGGDFSLEELDDLDEGGDALVALTEDLRSEDERAPSVDGHSHERTPIPNISTNWMNGASEPEEEEAAAPAPAAGEAPADEADEPTPKGGASVENLDTNDRVVAFLLRSGIVGAEQVASAKRRRREQHAEKALWRVLAQGQGVDRTAVYAEAARVYAFPIADLDEHTPDADFTRSVGKHFSEDVRERLFELGVAPFRIEADRGVAKLFLLTHDPMRPAVHHATDRLDVDRLELQFAPEKKVRSLISEAFPRTNEYLERMEDEDEGMDLGTSYEADEDLIDEDALEAEISRSKLINLFEATLVEAVHEGASDIHIYPNANREVEIHFRVDGRLKEWHVERKVPPEALLAVIKDNSMNVDRFEKDTAQDGFIQRRVDGALIRFRVSVMPIANADQDTRAESIVIRVLDDRNVIKDLSKLGLLEDALEKFRHAISQPHGMLIMTGPTGSGKSTTLVAALHEVVSPEVNVLTVEDPVEYVIQDVRQIKLSHKLQLEDALRSILRHDPDVVMVGEMRDRSTAELAIKLANTGHLTFSTLHTNDAPSAINRLYKMGIEPFLIAYAINLVVAQRLIRKLCPGCKTRNDDPDPVMLEQLGFSEEEIETVEFYKKGEDDHCPTCNGFGYKGRRAISEALHFSRAIRHMIVDAGETVDEDSIRQQAQEDGMFTLQGSARQVVKKGQTSVREMMRVVTTEIG